MYYYICLSITSGKLKDSMALSYAHGLKIKVKKGMVVYNYSTSGTIGI